MDKKKKIVLFIATVLTAVLILAACDTTFTVSFETNGGAPVASVTVDKQSLLNEREIPVPTKEDYSFAGWYKDKALSKPWEFSKDKVNKNLTLYAKYVPIPSVFAFSLNSDGQSYTVSANPTGSLGIIGPLEIPDTYSGKPVTAIAAEGFSGSIPSKIITEVKIPASVVSIGDKAFYKCLLLNKVTFEDGSALKEIGVSAFEGIPLLRSITLPASVQTIGERAFYDNFALATVEFGEGSALKTIGKHAFYGCVALTNAGVKTENSYAFPNSLTFVGERAFYNDARLANTGFEAGSALETIETYAFYKAALTSLFLPKTLTTVGSYAFAENQSLAAAVFEEGSVIATIPGYMFSNCISLSAIDIPASVTTINNNAFSNTKSLKKATLNSYISTSSLFYNSRIIEDGSKATAVVVPQEHLANYREKNISYSKYIVSVSEPAETASSYTKIVGEYLVFVSAGTDRTSSITVYFGTDENIEIDGASISAADAPFTNIDKFAFAGSRALKNLSIKNASDYTISDSAFAGCTNLSSATLTGVKSIGARAFSDTGLATLNLGSDLETIGDSAFQYCKQLTEVSIPSTVKEINGLAFAGCPALVSVAIEGDTLEKIGNSAFKDDVALSSISLPDSVTSIGAGAFWYCSSLTGITIPSGLTTIQSLTFAATGLTTIAIPSSVTEIDSEAFRGCTALAEIDFSAATELTTIGDSAFAVHSNKSFNHGNDTFNKYLHSVVLPASVTTVGDKAFDRTMVKVFYIGSLINAKDGIPDLSALLTLSGRVILIDAEEGDDLYDAYKVADGAKYKDNRFIAAKSSVVNNAFILGDDANGNKDVVLVAYVGIGTNPDLAGINEIGAFAFAYSVKLTGIDIKSNIGVIGESAFESCINLTSIVFDDKTGMGSYSISKNAFKNCSSAGLNEGDVVVRGPVTFVGMYAFSGWTNGQKITFDFPSTETRNWASNWYAECYAERSFKNS